jgi:hypothetical protein
VKIFFGLCTIFLVSCSSTAVKKEIQEEKARLKSEYDQPINREDMVSRAHHLFLESPYYTEEQKLALQNLMTETRAESAKLDERIYETKLVLFKVLFSDPKHGPQHKEIEEIERQLGRTHRQKMNLMIKALYESKRIIGQSDEETQLKNYNFFLDRFKLAN